MLKQALSEFRSQSMSMSSSTVNGKTKGAIKATEAAGRNGKGVKVTVKDTTSTKPKVEIEKVACMGEAGTITVFCHDDAVNWCPSNEIIDKLGALFTKEVRVEFYPRYLVGKVWSMDHCDKPYEKDYYAFRAYAGKDYCKIFVDETETGESVLWVLLHELAHIALADNKYLFRGYRNLTAPDYFSSDEAHEADPEEQMANAIAKSWMEMLGFGRVEYPRFWWRQRTMLNKQANWRYK